MSLAEFSYQPRDQFMPLHQREQRWACMVAHRRAGKTVACVNELITRATYTRKRAARYGYVAPFYSQAKEIAWEYLKFYSAPLNPKVLESELSVVLPHNGAKIQLYGADNPDKFRGVYFDGVVLDEYGDMKPSVWTSNLRPTLADRKGWAIFIGTPKGKNHFYKIFQNSLGYGYPEGVTPPKWFNLVIKASQSGLLAEEELIAMRAEMSDEEYEQELECSFDAAVMGTYYAKLIGLLEGKGQINATVEHDPDFPVYVATDLGYTDSSAYWFWQERPDGLAIIDYEEAHSQALPYYFELLASKGYRYGAIWLPHDARAKSLQTGRSTVEQFIDFQFPVFDENAGTIIRVAPNLSIQHGIDAARLLLPHCYFNLDRTVDGVEALRAYRRKWDEEKKVFSDAPVHDWASHGSDAFRYLALVAKERIVRPTEVEITRRMPDQIIQFSLDQLYAMNNSPKRRFSRV